MIRFPIPMEFPLSTPLSALPERGRRVDMENEVIRVRFMTRASLQETVEALQLINLAVSLGGVVNDEII